MSTVLYEYEYRVQYRAQYIQYSTEHCTVQHCTVRPPLQGGANHQRRSLVIEYEYCTVLCTVLYLVLYFTLLYFGTVLYK